jgi:predicted AlkP superfamily pyrophosphatase or phosphodiesterase
LKRTAVINVVGLTPALLGPATPRLAQFLGQGAAASVVPAFPAVTCTAQSNYLTGATPARHGIVANGWYDRGLAEVQFWKQSNHLVTAPKIWEQLREVVSARGCHSSERTPLPGPLPTAWGEGMSKPGHAEPGFTCAQLFWWHNMYAAVDYSITPRPIYPADGRKVFDIYAWPYAIREEIKRDLGEFPFAAFWGPAAGVSSPQGGADAASRWIAESAKWIENKFAPTLSLIYLPHLDYNLQRHGPEAVRTNRFGDLARIDAIAGDLISFFRARGVQIILLSEYGVAAVDRPVHLNRLFRKKGWLTVKDELGLEMLDCGASKVFAVADHQVAHIYLNDPSLERAVRDVLQNESGVETVLGAAEKTAWGIDHARAGDLVAVAAEGAWFTYYYWLEDARAPDFARCVDIHRKPGFDPVELFLDPKIPLVKLQILWRLLRKNLGFRTLLDVIPLDASLVQGSHGRRAADRPGRPIFVCESPLAPLPGEIDSTDVCGLIKNQVTGGNDK